jgi:acylphosphatase
MPDQPVKRVRARIVGRVHGVYFRASTQQRARSLGLSGWVRNTADGAVELEAQGQSDAVDQLLAWCHQGPPAARVTGVQAHDVAGIEPAEHDFVIRR